MADRTEVALSLYRKHYDQIKEETWFEEPQVIMNAVPVHDAKASHTMVPPARVDLYYAEVNFGELDFLSELQNRGIAYDSTWSRGEDYGAGTQYCRFTPEGELKVFDLYEGSENPPITELRARLTKPLQLVEYIKQYERDHTPLPWDNQVEYGKRYLTKKLLKSG